MKFSEILENYLRIEEVGGKLEVYVKNMWWVSSYETEHEWNLAYSQSLCEDFDSIPLMENPYGLEKYGIRSSQQLGAIEKVLDMKTYFKTCDDCGTRNPTFNMERRICRSCIPVAEGIVY
jgi:hypothetical protein